MSKHVVKLGKTPALIVEDVRDFMLSLIYCVSGQKCVTIGQQDHHGFVGLGYEIDQIPPPTNHAEPNYTPRTIDGWLAEVEGNVAGEAAPAVKILGRRRNLKHRQRDGECSKIRGHGPTFAWRSFTSRVRKADGSFQGIAGAACPPTGIMRMPPSGPGITRIVPFTISRRMTS
jgi:hypothetical protein